MRLAVGGCIKGGQESKYRNLIRNFVEWFGRNHLLLNVSKTKEMVVDLLREKSVTRPINIIGEEVETVDSYRYLG